MQNYPLVTVICLCYNHADFVIESLESVVNQSYKNIEILIADDCSTDHSVTVIKNWLQNHPEIIFIANTQNKGNTKTFNQLLQLSKGEYIIDLAADDVLLKDCIVKQLEQFKQSSANNLGVVYGNLELIDQNNGHLGYYYAVNAQLKAKCLPPSGNIYLSVIGAKEKICSVGSLVKREVFDYTKGYDQNLAYEDLDLWIRASRVFDFEYLDAIVVKKRELKNSLYQTFFANNKKTRHLNYCTFLILKKAFALNTTIAENQALLKRVHYEMVLNYKNKNFTILFKYVILKLRIYFNFRKWL